MTGTVWPNQNRNRLAELAANRLAEPDRNRFAELGWNRLAELHQNRPAELSAELITRSVTVSPRPTDPMHRHRPCDHPRYPRRQPVSWMMIPTRLTKLDPMHGFSAETGGGVTILAISLLGIPVSTTHTITGAIIGVGAVSGVRSVRWIWAQRIVWAWIITIPAAGLFGWGIFELMSLFGFK